MILAILWILIFAGILYKMPFVRRSRIPIRYIWLAFGAKAIAAILYGYLHWYKHGGGDTWDYFHYGQVIFGTLPQRPDLYLRFVFGSINYIPTDPVMFTIVDCDLEHWTDERTYIMLRISALVSLFAFGRYEVHAVFFAFFSLLGLIAIYRWLAHYFSKQQKILYLFLFWQPSVLFWGSGMHKESVCLLCLGLLFYTFDKWLRHESRWQHIFMALLGGWLLFMVRPHVGLLLPPILLSWCSTNRYPRYIGLQFLLSYAVLLALVVFFDTYTRYSAFSILVEMQHNFIAYFKGDSDFYLPTLQPNLSSVLSFLPVALYNMLLLPTLAPFTLQNDLPACLAALENTFFLILLLGSIARTLYYRITWDTLWYVCILFALSHLALMGLITDNLGAILRYRTLAFVFMPTILAVYWHKSRADGNKRN